MYKKAKNMQKVGGGAGSSSFQSCVTAKARSVTFLAFKAKPKFDDRGWPSKTPIFYIKVEVIKV